MTAADRRILREAGPFMVKHQYCGNSIYIFTLYHDAKKEPCWWFGGPRDSEERRAAIERLLNEAARPRKAGRKR